MSGIETGEPSQIRIQEVSPRVSADSGLQRPRVKAKFLHVGTEKLYVKGVTYGTFRPGAGGNEYPNPKIVEQDFFQIATNGLNAIRTYTVPPCWLLDAAVRHGLYVMVGLPWEQHVAFLDDKKRVRDIEGRVRAGVRACARHPAVLCYAIGNEIPAPIVRWYGRRRAERFLERLHRAARKEDPEGLFTYVNYPTTEYLHLPFLDLVCFNAYLEVQERLAAYLARLHNMAGDRPLIMAEIGLDSLRHGEATQARVLEWQVRTTFAAGCAGAFVFAWTDEWHRGGYDIEEWDFGVTDRNRRPKPALAAIGRGFAEAPFPKSLSWPRISVVVCSCNGARTIRGCFEGLLRLEYPNFEVVVVNDGSTDATAAITQEYGFRLISTRNGGLSSARNIGLEAATGEIVAFIDDDARPEPHWLTYLAATFLTTSHAGVGGPNIAPPSGGLVVDCVANAPGGPIHVLLSDREAEHIPGCNMAFRKAALEAIGGFDPQFRVAGDDVDVCWRLRQQGWTLGFSPPALVWHRRRSSVGAYWKQQQNYGRAEALLERKWPEKYNATGHLAWAGSLYGKGLTRALSWRRGRIYQGTWGSALFQSIYQPAPGTLWLLPTMPEWYLLLIALTTFSVLGTLWPPLLFTLPLLVLAAGVLIVQASLSAARAVFARGVCSRMALLKRYTLTAFLHLLQPLARLSGRLGGGLTLWRRRGLRGLALPWPQSFSHWSERWRAPAERLESLERDLRRRGASILRSGDYDRWDMEVRDGTLGAVRMRMAIEEHGAGKQLIRFRSWPRCSPMGLSLLLLFGALATGAALDQAWAAFTIFGVSVLLLGLRMFRDCAVAAAAVRGVLERGAVGE